MNNRQAIMRFILLAAVFGAVAFLGEQGKLIGGVFMSDQQDDGLMIHYKQDFTEISSDDLDRLMADRSRLEWLANHGATIEIWGGDGNRKWGLQYWKDFFEECEDPAFTEWHDTWRDAIDEAMRGE